jgi:hypothetical protein
MAKDRRAAKKAKKAKKKAPKKAASKAKSSGAAPAHANERRGAGARYDRCSDERFDLDTARTSFADKPKPPRFIRGRVFKNLPRSEDGWVPGEKKPPKCKLTYKQLAERWAAERSKAELDQYKKDCVWAKWCPGMCPPEWWRLDLDDDATYYVLCFCWAKNIRCYQPVLGLDFKEFCTKALKGDSVAKALISIDTGCRGRAEKAWLKKHKKKPKKCDDSVYIERRLLRPPRHCCETISSTQARPAASSSPSSRRPRSTSTTRRSR